jgi:hypothetical protein
MPILHSVSATTKRDDVRAGARAIQVVSPRLHRLATLKKALGLVVCGLNPVPFGMSKL